MGANPMCEILSASGISFIVDKCDKSFVEKYKWHIGKDSYPITRVNGKPIRLHTMLMYRICGQSGMVDHINRNKLDNRRCNLRLVTARENVLNRGVGKNNRSGVKGVYFDKSNGKWRSQITVNYKTITLGRFTTYDAAVTARKRAERKYGYET